MSNRPRLCPCGTRLAAARPDPGLHQIPVDGRPPRPACPPLPPLDVGRMGRAGGGAEGACSAPGGWCRGCPWLAPASIRVRIGLLLLKRQAFFEPRCPVQGRPATCTSAPMARVGLGTVPGIAQASRSGPRRQPTSPWPRPSGERPNSPPVPLLFHALLLARCAGTPLAVHGEAIKDPERAQALLLPRSRWPDTP